MGSFDIDEFVVVLGQNVTDAALLGREKFLLRQFLDEFRAAKEGAVIIDRMIFDANGHKDRPEGLVIQAYTSRLVQLRKPRLVNGKLLVLMDAVLKPAGAHEVKLKPPWTVATADHAPWSNSTQHHTYEPFRINHYSSRSFAECIEKSVSERRAAGNWRRVAGRAQCERFLVGTKLYHQRDHGPDQALASSRFPHVVQAVLRELQNVSA